MVLQSNLFNASDKILFVFGDIDSLTLDEIECNNIELLSENSIDATIVIRFGGHIFLGNVCTDEESTYLIKSSSIQPQNSTGEICNTKMKIKQIYLKQLIHV